MEDKEHNQDDDFFIISDNDHFVEQLLPKASYMEQEGKYSDANDIYVTIVQYFLNHVTGFPN